MSQNDCVCGSGVKLPVNGLSLVDPSEIGVISEERIRQIIREELVLNPGGGIIPRLQVGVETLWPSIVEGKQVYAQWVDGGELPSGRTVTIEHGISDIDWFSLDFGHTVIYKSDGSTLPPGFGGNTSWIVGTSLRPTAIDIVIGSSYKIVDSKFCLLYTKLSDPVIA